MYSGGVLRRHARLSDDDGREFSSVDSHGHLYDW